MNVSELRAALARYPDDLLVVMSKDSEGNDFSPLYEATSGVYRAESTWGGGFNDGDDDYPANAVCFWPVN